MHATLWSGFFFFKKILLLFNCTLWSVLMYNLYKHMHYLCSNTYNLNDLGQPKEIHLTLISSNIDR